jgi:hypothetical protein
MPRLRNETTRRGPQRIPGRFLWHQRLASPRPIGGCQRIVDTHENQILALNWLGGEGNDPAGAAERRAESLLNINRGVLRDFRIESDLRRQNGQPVIIFRTSSSVGALPLLSPVTGRPDFGLFIEPRFPWTSIGEVLSTTGFRVVPRLLPLPELPYSDRRIPQWVLSSIVLMRIKHLLNKLDRRFTVSDEDLPYPKGTINWTIYATERLSMAAFLSIPCRFSDLRDDFRLKSAIHYVLREHKNLLLSQRHAGLVVMQLLILCETLIARVVKFPPYRPQSRELARWHQQPMLSRIFLEGLQAIEWTIEERGLAGLSELAGLSWQLDMEQFFESWVETLADCVARCTGAESLAGRRNETKVSITWKPAYIGSQGSLIPDVVIKTPDTTLILDAKYKAHAEEIQLLGWSKLEDIIREHHRNDLLQVLAYSTLYDTTRTIACLVYPCRLETYESLKTRKRVASRAIVHQGSRSVELALVAVPMSGHVETIVDEFLAILHCPLSN